MNKSRRLDSFDKVSNQIIELLDAGVVPWQKPYWQASKEYGQQRSVDGREYSGLNALMLGLMSGVKGYVDPRWITFNQAKSRGGMVRRGEKGLHVGWWNPQKHEREIENPDTGEMEKKQIMIWYFGGHTVFNVEQVDGLELKPLEKVDGGNAGTKPENSPDTIAEAEAVATAYLESDGAPGIEWTSTQTPHYIPSEHRINMTLKDSFYNAPEMYSTLFHEMSHSTSKPLARKKGQKGATHFGSDNYGQEELVAEFSSAFLCDAVNITSTIQNSASYIDNWKKAIKADRKLIVYAASQGVKSADYILNTQEK